MEHCIIIGASHAGAQLCVSLRQGGYEGDITLIGEEADMPYHRPPLSKDFLSGGKAIDEILLRPASVCGCPQDKSKGRVWKTRRDHWRRLYRARDSGQPT